MTIKNYIKKLKHFNGKDESWIRTEDVKVLVQDIMMARDEQILDAIENEFGYLPYEDRISSDDFVFDRIFNIIPHLPLPKIRK